MQVYITCNAAMSTGILQIKLTEEAEKRHLDMKFEAIPMTDLNKVIDKADVVLVSPQIRFAKDEIQKEMGEKIVLQLGIQDFGLMNAPKIMDDILAATQAK